jgi:putative CocE/NonD family hydrolase
MHLVGGRTPQPVDVPLWERIFAHRPLAKLHEELGRDDVWWEQWLEQPPDVAVALERIAAPVLFVTGWWDGALASTVSQWESTANASLLVGPWDSESVRHPRAEVGGLAWGPSAVVDPDELLVDWFARCFGGERLPGREARVFVTGRNEWTSVDGLAGSASPLWLSSGGRANTRRGDGRLVPAPAEAEQPADRFVHDPERPVMWQPGGGSFSRSGPKLVLDTSFATARDEVLAYESAPVTETTVLRGRPSARLWVQSTAEDADWIVALEDVFPGGGRSVHLAHGVLRAPAREPRELGIELTPLAHELLRGHALRLLVASSLGPLYGVNLGGGDYLRETEPRRSEHAVLHGGRYASRLEVPLA